MLLDSGCKGKRVVTSIGVLSSYAKLKKTFMSHNTGLADGLRSIGSMFHS